jgi:hypothetical protein
VAVWWRCGASVVSGSHSVWQLWRCHQKSNGRFWIVYCIHNYTYVYMPSGSRCHTCHGCHALINQQLSVGGRYPQDCHADCHTFRAAPVANVAPPPQKRLGVFGTATPATRDGGAQVDPARPCRSCADALPAWPGRTRGGHRSSVTGTSRRPGGDREGVYPSKRLAA